jgi:hypothetical protein
MKKRSDGRYVKRITLPTGKRMDVYAETQKELQEKIDSLRLSFAMGVTSFDGKITVEAWAEKWWEASQGDRLEYNTKRGYVLALNSYILPFMGRLKLKDIRPIHCQGLINSISDKSKSLQRQILVCLSGMFRYACQNGLGPCRPLVGTNQ